MKLELITLTGAKLQEDVYQVVLPTAVGDIAVLPGHMPMVSLAVAGVIEVTRRKGDSPDEREYFATNGGMIEVSPRGVRVLVDEADHADEIHAETAQKALEHAQKLKEQAQDQIELSHAQALIDRHAVRLKVAELRRGRRVKR